jgi:hypothetical protein
METPTSTAPVIDDGEIDDRRKIADGVADDRRKSIGDRRSSPRKKTLKGARIVWSTGAPVRCVIRNLSEGGAKIDVPCAVPGTFDLVFDSDQSRRRCRVVWCRENQIGVQFLRLEV